MKEYIADDIVLLLCTAVLVAIAAIAGGGFGIHWGIIFSAFAAVTGFLCGYLMGRVFGGKEIEGKQ